MALYNEEHQHTTKCNPLLQKSDTGFVETPSDDCWCETHKNDTLLLAAVKLTLRKLGKTEFATALFEHPIELMNYSVCTVKDF